MFIVQYVNSLPCIRIIVVLFFHPFSMPKVIWKVYLSVIRHIQITLRSSRAPRVFLNTMALASAIRNPKTVCKPTDKNQSKTTNNTCNSAEAEGAPHKSDADIVMLWAVASLCFFGFFRSGEITVPSLTSFDASKHLTWEDVAVDSIDNPQTLKVHLKTSKTDQLGRGVDLYIGKTDCPLCPLKAMLHYMAIQDRSVGPFFVFKNSAPIGQVSLYSQDKGSTTDSWSSRGQLCWPQLPHRSSHSSSQCRDWRLHNQDNGKIVKLSISGLHSYTQETTCNTLKVAGEDVTQKLNADMCASVT